MKLFSAPGAPAWLDPLLRRITQGLREQWDSPLMLRRLPTASLPTAADWPGGVVYDETTAEVKRSNGTAWAAIGGSGGVSDGDKGDVVVSGSGATWTIDSKAVSLAKQADIATSRIMGRVTAATGVQEALTGTQATTLLDTFTSALKGLAPASGGGTSNYLRADGTWAAPSAGGVSDGDKGDITVSGSGATWTIDADVVTYAKMQNVSATDKLLGRSTAGAGDVEEITCTAAGRAILDDADAAAQRTTLGLGTADSPQFTALNIGNASDTTLARSGAGDLTVEGNAIYRAGGTDVPIADGGTGASTAAAARVNLLPSITGNSLKVLRVNVGETDFELATVSGTGDFSGPGSSTDTAVVLFNGTGGKTGKNSNFLVNTAGIPAITSNTGLAAAIGPTIASYFSADISLDASSTYEIECLCYFLKTTAGTVTWTWHFSSAPTMAGSFYTGTPATGYTTTTITGALVSGEAHVQAQADMAHAATASLTTAVYHSFRFTVNVRTNGATTINIRATESAGTITPQAGSYMRATKII